jgi:AmiR/NasT family two-component response regulator
MASRVADGHDGTAVSSDREERLTELVVALADENANLQRALDTRVVIEQAKGVLAERFDVDVHEAFRLLRLSARSNRMRLHALATQVVESRQTPPEIDETRLGRRPASRA